MRCLLLAAVMFVIGYFLGTLFGYRSAVVDYVENDAQTIRTMADTMYDAVEVSAPLSQAVQEAVDDVENGADGDDGGEKGFQ